MEAKKHSWHGPKQIGMMIYTAILFLIGTSIIGGNNNTVFPMFSEIRGWDVNIINVVSGLSEWQAACMRHADELNKRDGIEVAA